MTFTITGPGEYRTRDGRKAVIGKHAFYHHCVEGNVPTLGGNLTWNPETGKCYAPPDSDIIGPWKEPQPVTPPRELVQELIDWAQAGIAWLPFDMRDEPKKLIAEAKAWLEANP
jgi:hypothetical protein